MVRLQVHRETKEDMWKVCSRVISFSISQHPVTCAIQQGHAVMSLLPFWWASFKCLLTCHSCFSWMKCLGARACMCMRVHGCLQTLEVSDHSGTGVRGGCWELNLGPLEGQHVFWTADSFLHSPFIAWSIKKNRQILGFSLKVRKAKQPATGSYLYLSPEWQSCL